MSKLSPAPVHVWGRKISRDMVNWRNLKEKHVVQITGKLKKVLLNKDMSKISIKNFHEVSSVKCVETAGRVQIVEQQ